MARISAISYENPFCIATTQRNVHRTTCKGYYLRLHQFWPIGCRCRTCRTTRHYPDHSFFGKWWNVQNRHYPDELRRLAIGTLLASSFQSNDLCRRNCWRWIPLGIWLNLAASLVGPYQSSESVECARKGNEETERFGNKRHQLKGPCKKRGILFPS